MCLLCSDEKVYRAYMDYLNAMERRGEIVDPDEAMEAVLDKLQADNQIRAADPSNDRTLSPFFCSAVVK